MRHEISLATHERSDEPTYLERDELDQRSKRIGRNEAHIVIGIAHSTEDWYNEKDDVGQDLHVEELHQIWN